MTDQTREFNPGSRAPSRSSLQLTVLFLFLGLSVFLIDRCVREDPQSVIVVDDSEVQRLTELWEGQAQRLPTEDELDALIKEFVREEILVREAIRLGLDQDDVIIRRRLAQKMSFLLDDTSEAEPPTEAELRSYFEQNAASFGIPQRTSFQHIFSSRAPSDEEEDEILGALASGTSWRTLGDPFMLRREYADRTNAEIDELFGRGFAQRLEQLSLEEWHPSIPSALGFHTLRISRREPATSARFDTVRNQVFRRYLDEKGREANREAYEEVASRYRVEVP